MGISISSGWWLAPSIILLVLMLPGGFFMFRAFLRRMKREENLED